MFIGEPRFLHDPERSRPAGRTFVAGPSLPGAVDHCRSWPLSGSTRPGWRRFPWNRAGTRRRGGPRPGTDPSSDPGALDRPPPESARARAGGPATRRACRRTGSTAGAGFAGRRRRTATPPWRTVHHMYTANTANRATEHIGPAQPVPAEGPPDLEPEGHPAHGQSHRQGDVRLGGVDPRRGARPVRRPLVRPGRGRVRYAGSSLSVRDAGCVHRQPPYRDPWTGSPFSRTAGRSWRRGAGGGPRRRPGPPR